MTAITETEVFVCEECDKSFKNARGLAGHNRMKHPEPSQVDDGRIAELESQLKDALLQASEAKAEADEFRPTRSIEGFFTSDADDVVIRFGRQKIEDLAHRELAEVNRRRAKENLPLITYSGEEKEAAIDRVIEELLQDRTKNGAATEGPLLKTLKMIKPDGNLVQIPYEGQINNLRGSLEDAIARYRNKGYKLAVDKDGRTVCPSQNCNEMAVVEGGNNTFGGYCSADHRMRTEKAQEQGTSLVSRPGDVYGA